MANKLYIVTMYRWGNRENHSYFLGVFTDKEKAIEAGESHSEFRGGKYAPEILEVDLDYVYYEKGKQVPDVIVDLYKPAVKLFDSME